MKHGVVTSITFFSFVFIPLLAAADEAPPAIPPLLVGSEQSPSFLVQGICRFAPTKGLGFQFATDGSRQFFALFDLADGTPIFLSDGNQVLVYDLSGSRIVRMPDARAYVVVDWNAMDERPMTFSTGVQTNSDPAALAAWNSRFRIDRFVIANREKLRRLELDGAAEGTHLFAAERDGRSEVVKVDHDRSWFRFGSFQIKDDFYALEFIAMHIGKPIPAEAMAFPDLASLRTGFPVVDLEGRALFIFVEALHSGRAVMAKMALAAGEEFQEFADEVMPGTDWQALGRRDAELGERYRTALARQGIRFSAFEGMAKPPADR